MELPKKQKIYSGFNKKKQINYHLKRNSIYASFYQLINYKNFSCNFQSSSRRCKLCPSEPPSLHVILSQAKRRQLELTPHVQQVMMACIASFIQLKQAYKGGVIKIFQKLVKNLRKNKVSSFCCKQSYTDIYVVRSLLLGGGQFSNKPIFCQ